MFRLWWVQIIHFMWQPSQVIWRGERHEWECKIFFHQNYSIQGSFPGNGIHRQGIYKPAWPAPGLCNLLSLILPTRQGKSFLYIIMNSTVTEYSTMDEAKIAVFLSSMVYLVITISYFGIRAKVHKFWTLQLCRKKVSSPNLKERRRGKCTMTNFRILKSNLLSLNFLLPAPLRPTLLTLLTLVNSRCRIFYVRKVPFIKISFSFFRSNLNGWITWTVTHHNVYILKLKKYYLQRFRSVDGTCNIVSLIRLRFIVAV